MNTEEVLKKMNLREKAELCVGEDYWHSKAFEQYGINKITMSDGPHGLRVQKKAQDNLGINESEVSICFPSLATVGNSWNKETVENRCKEEIKKIEKFMGTIDFCESKWDNL